MLYIVLSLACFYFKPHNGGLPVLERLHTIFHSINLYSNTNVTSNMEQKTKTHRSSLSMDADTKNI